MNLQRAGSSAYWDSEAWNPDDRVYVGASEGQKLWPQWRRHSGYMSLQQRWKAKFILAELRLTAGITSEQLLQPLSCKPSFESIRERGTGGGREGERERETKG